MVDHFAGARAAEPTATGIVAAVDDLLDDAEWRAVVSGATSIDFEGEVERWVRDYERVYDAALATKTTALPSGIAV
jgi:hypothetical protein